MNISEKKYIDNISIITFGLVLATIFVDKLEPHTRLFICE